MKMESADPFEPIGLPTEEYLTDEKESIQVH